MEIKTFDQQREIREQNGTEWQFGAIPTDLALVQKKKAGLPVGKYRLENSPKWKGGIEAKNRRTQIKRQRMHICKSCFVAYSKQFGRDSTSKYCLECRTVVNMCSYCLKDFRISQKDIDEGRGKYCSRPCALEHYSMYPLTGEHSARWINGANSTLTRRNRLRAQTGSFTKQEWIDLKKKYDYICLCCKKQEPEIKLTVDHIVPVSKGGTGYISNIQPLCLRCNKRKSTKTIKYYL